MDFVQYASLLPSLNEMGMAEVSDEEGIIRLELEPDENLKSIHIRDESSKVPPYPDAIVLKRSANELADLVEHALDRFHLTEVLVVPVSNWKQVIACVAFDMAKDEEWTEIDALAALHQNTRNALAVTRAETQLLIDMVRSLLTNGTESGHDLIITSDVAPLLIEIFHDGALCITFEAGAIAEFHKSLAKAST